MQDAYYSNANPALLERVPATARSILEIGCGSGALGHLIKARSPAVHYVGVERVPEVANVARQSGLDHVLVGDVEKLDAQIAKLGPYDCIVYGDVLEHLVDPDSLLYRHCDLLSDGGLVLASIPNAQHWSLLVNLLRGRFPQEDAGLFDRTHLRWFTHDDVIAMIQRVGLIPWEMAGQCLGSQQESHTLARTLAPLLPTLGVDQATLQQRLAPLQWVVRAGREAPRPLQIDCIGLSPTTQAGMAHVRMLQPLQALCRQPGVVGRFSDQGLKLLADKACSDRVFIWQRPTLTYPDGLAKLRSLIESGYVVIVDYDDDPDFWPAIAEHQYLTFRGVHAVQVSTSALADVVRRFNPEVSIFQNAIPQLPELPQQPSDPSAGLSLFFGALNRGSDWAPYLDALNQLLSDCQGFLRVDVVHDRDLYDCLDTEHKTFVPTLAYADYCDRMTCADLVWMPLADTSFNRKKSDLKFLEAAARGLVSIASPTVYADVIKHGVTGILVDTPESFYLEVRALVESPDRCRMIGANARAWVAKHRLQAAQVGAREAWYRDLCRRREALTQNIFDRVPDLLAQ
jgi:SAM-dependent methyltransferase